MRNRAYISNIAKTWPVPAQEALLSGVVPDWPDASIYRDVLVPAKRRGQSREAMEARASMLRETRRKPIGETIYVASLPVLAWDVSDLTACLAAARARAATVIAVDAGLRIPPDAGADVLDEAVKLFLAKKRSAEAGGGRRVGAEASKRARMEDAQRRAESIRADWVRRDVPTPELLMRAGRQRKIGRSTVTIPMAYATAKNYLGHRPEAQRKHDLAVATAERNRARRKNDAES
jgi:hypothetical protein